MTGLSLVLLLLLASASYTGVVGSAYWLVAGPIGSLPIPQPMVAKLEPALNFQFREQPRSFYHWPSATMFVLRMRELQDIVKPPLFVTVDPIA
jgi:hypothetical protein